MRNSRGQWKRHTLVVDTLLYEIAIDDSIVSARPWTFQLPVRRHEGLMYEYACHHGNYGLENLLKSTRTQEQVAMKAETQGSR